MSDVEFVLATDHVLDRYVHDQLPTLAFACPHCRCESPVPGSPNVCEVCLGNQAVGGTLARLYLLEGIEGVRRWMRAWVR